jgi:FixJ family two-component response regulator
LQQVPVIHVVDDDESFQAGIACLLQAAGYRTRTYGSAGDFLLADFDEAPGCILMDIRMPGPNGLDVQRALARRAELLPIIFLTGYGDIPTAVRAIQSGASDFLTKPVKGEVLLGAIENALVRGAERRVLLEQLKTWRSCYQRLTPRETEVFTRVVAGKMNKEIASELGAAERTIKAHRAKVMKKMGVVSLADLVRIAEQLRTSHSAPAHQAHPNSH